MHLTSKGRYAVTALVDVALHEREGAVSLADISARQNIPISYLGHLLAQMSKHGLVNSQRGPGGGYHLAKSGDQISLADIINAVEEKIDNTRCGGNLNCQNNEICLTHALWVDLNSRLDDMFSGIRLYDVISQGGVRSVAKRQDRLMAINNDSTSTA